MLHRRMLALGLLLVGVPGCEIESELLRIVGPGQGRALGSPDTQVAVELPLPLGAGERLEAVLVTGIDAVGELPRFRDLTRRIEMAPDGGLAHIPLRALPPGRSELTVSRVLGGEQAVSGTITVDRGGYTGIEPGPFDVGVRSAQLVRSEERELELYVWYPTDASSGFVNPAWGGVRDAPLLEGAEALPLVLFSHGLCGSPLGSTFLSAALARAGFVVVSMSHPGSTLSDPACTLSIGDAERPRDVSATLDWLLEESDRPGSWLFRGIDPERIGMTGHSLGGQTTVQVAREDARIRAALPLAPPLAFVAQGLPVPTMIQGGSLDSVLAFETHQAGLYAQLRAPRFLVEIQNTGHFAFSDACFGFYPECGRNTLSQEEAHALVTRYALGFLGVYVAGDRRFEELLTPVEGVVLTEDR